MNQLESIEIAFNSGKEEVHELLGNGYIAQEEADKLIALLEENLKLAYRSVEITNGISEILHEVRDRNNIELMPTIG